MSFLRSETRRLLIALGYFTRVPIPGWVGWSAFELNRSARYFPLVGVGVGLVAAGIICGTSLALPGTLAVALSMSATVLLTGAFHEDGLADAVDGFGGGYEPERVLAIMQDSRIGSFGAIALILALLTKFSALLALLGQSLVTVAALFVIAHAGSRACALGVMRLLPYVRDQGSSKAKPVAEGIGAAEWATGVLIGITPLAFALTFDLISLASATLMLCAALLVLMLAVRYFRRRIGGYTGDCLGATQQLCEIAIYIAACVRLA